MNDHFQLFQDENARCTTFRPGVQPNPPNDSLVHPKGAMSARKALGNITNNNGGFQTNIKQQQASAIGVGGELLNNREDVCLSESQMAKDLPKESLSHKESQLASRIDDLISGGIEFSAGPTWEEQEALKELAMEDAVLSFDVTGHRRMVEGQIKNFCNDMIELDMTNSKKLNIIRDIIFSENDRVSEANFFEDTPLSPIETKRIDSAATLSQMDIYSDDDLCKELP